jgi:hypothetical protein
MLEALLLNDEILDSQVYIFCDNYKNGASNFLIRQVNEVRNLVNSYKNELKIEIIFRDENFGLSRNIITGVTYVLEKHEQIIVLEDDLIVSKGFLKYMNEALELYRNDLEVGCIHSWNEDVDMSKYCETTFFLSGADCWGWATWKRAWELFNPNGNVLLKQIISNNLQYFFNRRGRMDFIKMLEDQIIEKNDSWAIRWHASIFLNKMYCLYPVKSLIRNIGLDGSGTHSGFSYMNQNVIDFLPIRKIPINELECYYASSQKSNSYSYILKQFWKIKFLIKRLW